MNELSTKIENCISGINDRITSLNNQISCNDINISDAVENLSSTTNSIKTSFDQKTCQLLNKTSAIFDKMKENPNRINQSKPSDHLRHKMTTSVLKCTVRVSPMKLLEKQA